MVSILILILFDRDVFEARVGVLQITSFNVNVTRPLSAVSYNEFCGGCMMRKERLRIPAGISAVWNVDLIHRLFTVQYVNDSAVKSVFCTVIS